VGTLSTTTGHGKVERNPLWGSDFLVEALRVEGGDDPALVPSVRDRFARWADTAGKGRKLHNAYQIRPQGLGSGRT